MATLEQILAQYLDRQPAIAPGALRSPVFGAIAAPEAAGNAYGQYEEPRVIAANPQMTADRTSNAANPQVASPQKSVGGVMSGIGSVIERLVNPGGAENNQTVAFLQSQGMAPDMAAMLARNKPALQKYLIDYAQGPEAAKPIEVNGQLVDPSTGKVLGDYRDPQAPTSAWSKMDDGRLYNQQTGEIRDVGQPAGGAPANATDDIKEYQYAKDNGMFTGSFTEWQTKGIKEQDPTFQREMDLRQQYDALPEVKDYKVVRSNFERIRKGVEMGTGAGDAAIVFGYMKMLDPTSVVREGEQASARNAAGVPETIRGLYNTLVGGGTISEEARNQILSAAEQVYGESSSNIEELNTRYGGYASTYKLDPNRIISPVEKYDKAGGWKDGPGGVKIRRKQ